MNILKELSFGTINNIEEAKPLIWGLIIPWILVFVFKSVLPIIVVPGIAALIQLKWQDNKDKAAATIGYALLVPMCFLIIFLVGAILAVF